MTLQLLRLFILDYTYSITLAWSQPGEEQILRLDWKLKKTVGNPLVKISAH
jgi:hypothetical protein